MKCYILTVILLISFISAIQAKDPDLSGRWKYVDIRIKIYKNTEWDWIGKNIDTSENIFKINYTGEKTYYTFDNKSYQGYEYKGLFLGKNSKWIKIKMCGYFPRTEQGPFLVLNIPGEATYEFFPSK